MTYSRLAARTNRRESGARLVAMPSLSTNSSPHKNVGAAIDLYRGAFLDGVHVGGAAPDLEQWISDERSAVRAALLTAAATHIDQLLADEDSAGALALAQRTCLVRPDDEPAARRLIRVALAAGDRGVALRAFEEIERTLRREYDVSAIRGNHSPGGRPAWARRLGLRVPRRLGRRGSNIRFTRTGPARRRLRWCPEMRGARAYSPWRRECSWWRERG